MFVKTIFNISILLLLTTCKNNNNQINYNQSDRIITQDVNPEKIYFDLSDSADYSLDFRKALKDKDYRFVGILEFALTVPEVSDYIEKYRLSNGVKIINGTGDSFSYQDSTNNRIEFYRSYAKEYNKLLLDYLEKQK